MSLTVTVDRNCFATFPLLNYDDCRVAGIRNINVQSQHYICFISARPHSTTKTASGCVFVLLITVMVSVLVARVFTTSLLELENIRQMYQDSSDGYSGV